MDPQNTETATDASGQRLRIRTLTRRGQQLYETDVQCFVNELSKTRQEIDNLIVEINLRKDETEALKPLKQNLLTICDSHKEASDQFIDYLLRTHTQASMNELATQRFLLETVSSKVNLVVSAISHVIDRPVGDSDTVKATTVHSQRSHSTSNLSGSKRSSVSSVVIRQKAKHEAAKVRLKFIEQEAEIIKMKAEQEATHRIQQAEQEATHRIQQAELEVNRKILASKCDVMEAEAELNAMNEMLEDNLDIQPKSLDPELQDIIQQRTKIYVKNLKTSLSEHSELPRIPREHSQLLCTPQVTKDLERVPSVTVSDLDNNAHLIHLRPDTPEFVPEAPQGAAIVQSDPSNATTSGIKDFTKYIMKKDLLLSRLTQFNDRPERYCMWKTSFSNISQELEVTPTEELDLLCRWLGPESSKQATSLRAANCHDQSNAIKKIWERLDSRYGAPELVVQSFQERLEEFPKLLTKDYAKIYELSDLITEIDSLKEDRRYKSSLAYFDSSAGVNPIINKLPAFMQNRWTDVALRYKREYSVLYPPFSKVVEFIEGMAVRLNDPGFRFDPIPTSQVKSYPSSRNTRKAFENVQTSTNRFLLSTKKTDIGPRDQEEVTCPIHGETAKHSLKDCRTFHAKSIPDKKEVIQKYGMCFKCLIGKHLAKDCKENTKCNECGSTYHCSAFHINRETSANNGGEHKVMRPWSITGMNSQVDTKCTQICGNSFKGKSCAKTLLVKVYPDGRPEKSLKAYAIIDDQSNRSLARSEFFEHFGENSEEAEYILSSCAGKVTKSGKRATGYVIESMDGTCNIKCPTLIECNEIPNQRQEIATPAVARHYRHLEDIEQFVPEYEPNVQILLLIGRDMISAHHVLDQRVGSGNEPYAQKLRLGWAIIGETCLGMVHTTDTVTVNKTYVLRDGRESVFKPCPNGFELKVGNTDTGIGKDIFQRTSEDDELGLSKEDKEFFRIMEEGFTKSSNGNWSAPLPFRKDRPRLPNNYQQARQRAENLAKSLKRDPTKQKHFVEFMRKIVDNKHAEEAPPMEEGEERWYLPIFGVYHPKKPSKIRVVFDSSAKFNGLSLNDVLLTGPDLTNNLVGVLLKFRKERVAVTADVEQMFFNFEVHKEHRNLLRFVWFKDNDPAKELVEHRMCVHVFGNSPSPAVATYGLRKSVCNHEGHGNRCDDICKYVKENFYVDDALVSQQSEQDAVGLIMCTQERLKHGGNIRLHKIASNNANVLASFPLSDLAKNITEMDFNTGTPNVQRSLGMSWDVTRDIFTYQVSEEEKPYTKRGLLSTVNRIFDPLGFVAPVILGGRLFMREAVLNSNIGWDEPLLDKAKGGWKDWTKSLKELESLEIPRPFAEISVQESVCRELHVFADASREAIGAVAYLKLYDVNGSSQLGFVLGKSKVAPTHGHTIPRLELCAAVLATELAEFVSKYLLIDATYFYTDSQVVLGYINNETRRFYVYVANRVDRILKSSAKSRWNYVPTDKNPADYATRPMNVHELKNNVWLRGPCSFLDTKKGGKCEQYDLVNAESDKEIYPQVDVIKTHVSERLGSERFSKFSTWLGLTSAISQLKQIAAKYVFDKPDDRTKVDFQKDSEILILREIQREAFMEEMDCRDKRKSLPRNSSLTNLSPFLDQHGLLRVGGRLSKAQICTQEQNPVIVSGKHHVATLLVRHYHEQVQHQGRHITEGSVRSAGYWIIGGKRLINSVIHRCVKCRKLRGNLEHQKMSDLPSDRLTPSPPFTYVGIDTFGPWSIVTRRTRGGQANSKRWAIMFSCLVMRAIHIEVIEELSSSSFINALRRLIALRGPVKEFRSDRVTNFVGATDDLGISALNVEDGHFSTFLLKSGTVWKFNPPHASHMSGSWERMIGLARRILDSMLCKPNTKCLTHEVLCTLMAEVCAIINGRPIATVSNDPEDPMVVSPSILLTQKVNSDIEPFENINVKDMYKAQWRHVQVLAEQFWKMWNNQYLHNLQHRHKWHHERRNLETGDIVVMMDSDVPRNRWPVAVVEKVFPSCDRLVRKASVRVIKDDKPVTYTRPITQLVYLFSK